jgi:hypothetical protein
VAGICFLSFFIDCWHSLFLGRWVPIAFRTTSQMGYVRVPDPALNQQEGPSPEAHGSLWQVSSWL